MPFIDLLLLYTLLHCMDRVDAEAIPCEPENVHSRPLFEELISFLLHLLVLNGLFPVKERQDHPLLSQKDNFSVELLSLCLFESYIFTKSHQSPGLYSKLQAFLQLGNYQLVVDLPLGIFSESSETSLYQGIIVHQTCRFTKNSFSFEYVDRLPPGAENSLALDLYDILSLDSIQMRILHILHNLVNGSSL